jgi:hypothetical protein
MQNLSLRLLIKIRLMSEAGKRDGGNGDCVFFQVLPLYQGNERRSHVNPWKISEIANASVSLNMSEDERYVESVYTRVCTRVTTQRLALL